MGTPCPLFLSGHCVTAMPHLKLMLQPTQSRSAGRLSNAGGWGGAMHGVRTVRFFVHRVALLSAELAQKHSDCAAKHSMGRGLLCVQRMH